MFLFLSQFQVQSRAVFSLNFNHLLWSEETAEIRQIQARLSLVHGRQLQCSKFENNQKKTLRRSHLEIDCLFLLCRQLLQS